MLRGSGDYATPELWPRSGSGLVARGVALVAWFRWQRCLVMPALLRGEGTAEVLVTPALLRGEGTAKVLATPALLRGEGNANVL